MKDLQSVDLIVGSIYSLGTANLMVVGEHTKSNLQGLFARQRQHNLAREGHALLVHVHLLHTGASYRLSHTNSKDWGHDRLSGSMVGSPTQTSRTGSMIDSPT